MPTTGNNRNNRNTRSTEKKVTEANKEKDKNKDNEPSNTDSSSSDSSSDSSDGSSTGSSNSSGSDSGKLSVSDKTNSDPELPDSPTPEGHKSESLGSSSENENEDEDGNESNSLDDFIIPDDGEDDQEDPNKNKDRTDQQSPRALDLFTLILLNDITPLNLNRNISNNGNDSNRRNRKRRRDDSDGSSSSGSSNGSSDGSVPLGSEGSSGSAGSDPFKDGLSDSLYGEGFDDNHLDQDRPRKRPRRQHRDSSGGKKRKSATEELELLDHNRQKIRKRRQEKQDRRKIYRDLPPIETLDDLIAAGREWIHHDNEVWPIDMFSLKRLVEPLEKLQAMIGMQSVKQTILKQILTILGGFAENLDMVHCVIEGPPGCGKTTVAMILSEIYQALGYSNGNFITAKRADLVAGYLGQTTIKTQKVIDEAIGGVLFIDEAYSLGNSEQRDSFAKEVIDTLNQNLSEHAGELICIIAGYEKELDQCFFAYNPGLKRRFRYRHTIEKYSASELREIFLKKVRDRPGGWRCLEEAAPLKFFQTNYKYFTFAGGDMESLLDMTVLCHTFRVFGKHSVKRKVITAEDIKGGFEIFTANKEVRGRVQDPDAPPPHMYV